MNGVPLAWVCRPFAGLGVDALYALLRLRQQVFVLEQNCTFVDADGVDPQCWHLLGWSAGNVLQAALRIVPPGAKFEEASIGRVVTQTAMRGSGLGQELVAKGVARCLQLHPGTGIRISAQAHLQRFYERFGFVVASERYLEDGIWHIDMLRAERRAVVRPEVPAGSDGGEDTVWRMPPVV